MHLARAARMRPARGISIAQMPPTPDLFSGGFHELVLRSGVRGRVLLVRPQAAAAEGDGHGAGISRSDRSVVRVVRSVQSFEPFAFRRFVRGRGSSSDLRRPPLENSSPPALLAGRVPRSEGDAADPADLRFLRPLRESPRRLRAHRRICRGNAKNGSALRSHHDRPADVLQDFRLRRD
jgi:hypothetical protein